MRQTLKMKRITQRISMRWHSKRIRVHALLRSLQNKLYKLSRERRQDEKENHQQG